MHKKKFKDIYTIMCENCERFGDKIYIESVDQEKNINFYQLNNYCNKVANFLKDQGIKKDNKVSLIGKNSIETMIIFFGVLKYGAIINPINVEESKENIYRILNVVKPKLVIYDKEMAFEQKRYRAYSWLRFSNFDIKKRLKNEFFSFLKDYESIFQSPIGNRDDIAEIVFTSGTTAIPKGVVISREGFFYMVEELVDKLKITEKDRILEYRAYSWASTQLLSIMSSMSTGATLVLAREFSRSRFPLWLKKYNITISVGVPTVINMLINRPIPLHRKDVPSLKFVTSSSAPLSIESHKTFEKLYDIPINQMAGMTEAGWMIGNPPEKRKIGSVGTPFKYKEITFLNERRERCNVGEEGEMVVKGKSMGVGYIEENGEIAKFPEEGFLTGDLGYEDSNGYVYFSGRKKELIIRGGVNISPMEITNRLKEHPYVKEAATIGVPDKIYGEEIACFIVPKPGHKVEIENVVNHCRGTLPEFKIPKYIYFVKQIPKTERGKLMKSDLIKMVYLENGSIVP